MRKLRWLAIALAVIAAPAAWVFASDLYFLGLDDDQRLKEHLLSEIGNAHDRSGFNMGLYNGGDLVFEKEKRVFFEPSLWEITQPCEEVDRKVHLLDIDDLSLQQQVNAHSRFRHTQRIYRSTTWIFPASRAVSARSISNFELAALNACYRATPFYQMCKNAYLKDTPTEQEVAEVLVERGILDRLDYGYCWAKETFSASEPVYNSDL